MGYQSKTYSLSDEVVAVIEGARAAGLTPNQFLRRTFGIEEGAAVPEVSSDPRQVPGVSVGLPEKTESVGFHCRCIHSGCGGRKFTGATRYATLCDECREQGHLGNPKDCPECLLN